jgi:hypothetical protein
VPQYTGKLIRVRRLTDGRRRFPVVVVHTRVLTNPTRGELQRVLDEHRTHPSSTGADARSQRTPCHPRRGAGHRPQFIHTSAPHDCISGEMSSARHRVDILPSEHTPVSEFSRQNERVPWRSTCSGTGALRPDEADEDIDG